MFDIQCGCNGSDRSEMLSWFKGLPPKAKANIMGEIEILKSAGLGPETAIALLKGGFEPHVVNPKNTQYYFLLARSIADNNVIMLGRTEVRQGVEYASEKAIAATIRFFHL
jgi:hypothetical protein